MLGKEKREKVYPNISDNNDTAISKKSRMFIKNIEKTFCGADESGKYNDSFKRDVEQFININKNVFEPTTTENINPPDTDDPLLQKITLEEIKNEIKQLSVKKARGDDNINNKVIKSLQDQLTPILNHLFNISIEIGYIPKIWKSAQLCTIYKENKPKDRVETYKPDKLCWENTGKNLN